jgi:hypothetical protein
MTTVVLPSVLTIGFTGHRRLADESGSRLCIAQLLTELKSSAPGVVCGLSSVAAGGDLLFAESCLDLGIPLRVLLPLPIADFRADFDAATWERVESVLKRAAARTITGAHEDTREASYYECGVQTVAQSDVMIALWDGQPSQGLGGTEQIVNFARAEGRPVYWLHSVTGRLERLGCEHALDRDAELDFLNSLPEQPAGSPANARALVEAWFSKLDLNATRAAPRARRILTVSVVCTAVAALLNTFSSSVEGDYLWLALASGLGLTAAALPKVGGAKRRQIYWGRIRTAAEICRSSLALWNAPGPYTLIGAELVPELRGMLSALNYLKASAAQELSADAFRERYRNDRVRAQLEYFARYADIAKRKAGQYAAITAICIALALAANAWILVDKVVPENIAPFGWQPALALAGATFFQIATIVAALLAMNDYKRRRQRYREMERLLERWDRQLEVTVGWPALLRIAGRVERELLAEIVEWRALIRHRELAQR